MEANILSQRMVNMTTTVVVMVEVTLTAEVISKRNLVVPCCFYDEKRIIQLSIVMQKHT